MVVFIFLGLGTENPVLSRIIGRPQPWNLCKQNYVRRSQESLLEVGELGQIVAWLISSRETTSSNFFGHGPIGPGPIGELVLRAQGAQGSDPISGHTISATCDHV